MIEVFKDIPNYDGVYQISNLGRVKSLKWGKVRYMTVCKNTAGYEYVNLKTKNHLIHRLIAIAFIPNIENKPHINHINGIKHDNRIINLEWCTPSENQIHASKTGLTKAKNGESNPASKLNASEVLEIRQINDMSFSKRAEKYNVTKGCIQGIIQRKTWSHL